MPSKSSGEPTASAAELVKAVRNFLVIRLGGCTEISAKGYYEDKKNQIVVPEQVTYFYAFSSLEKIEEHAGEIKRLANAICIEFDQSEVALEVDNLMFSYKPEPPYRAKYVQDRAAAILEGRLSFFMEQVYALKLDGDK